MGRGAELICRRSEGQGAALDAGDGDCVSKPFGGGWGPGSSCGSRFVRFAEEIECFGLAKGPGLLVVVMSTALGRSVHRRAP